MANQNLPFTVNFWTFDPETLTDPHDGPVMGSDFSSEADARAYMGTCPVPHYISHVELDGPALNEVSKNPGYVHEPDSYQAERQEALWQHRMGFGCDD